MQKKMQSLGNDKEQENYLLGFLDEIISMTLLCWV